MLTCSNQLLEVKIFVYVWRDQWSWIPLYISLGLENQILVQSYTWLCTALSIRWLESSPEKQTPLTDKEKAMNDRKQRWPKRIIAFLTLQMSTGIHFIYQRAIFTRTSNLTRHNDSTHALNILTGWDGRALLSWWTQLLQGQVWEPGTLHRSKGI